MPKVENPEDKQNQNDDEVSEDEDEEILGAVREHQSKQNSNTCMIRREPQAMVVENHTNQKNRSEKCSRDFLLHKAIR